VYSPTDGLQFPQPHRLQDNLLELAPDGRSFVTYGADASIELWSATSMSRTSVIDTQQSAISGVAFLDDSRSFIAAGRDGKLVQWTTGAEPTLLAHFDQAITNFAIVKSTKSLIVATTNGAVWKVDEAGRTLPLIPGGAQITRLTTIAGSAIACIGDANGNVMVIDTSSSQQTRLLTTLGAIRDIAVSKDGRTIAIAAHDDTIHVAIRRGDTWHDHQINWSVFNARARRIVFTPDGLLVSICTDGTIWLYSPVQRHWLCIPTGTADLGLVTASNDGNHAAALDTDGRIIWIDLALARLRLDSSFQ
jgi:WD40 repeat protein